MPTVLERVLQQALRHTLQPPWAPTCSAGSDGCRPGCSAPQAMARAQQYGAAGYAWGVDVDREKCFDRVHHDKLMRLVKDRVRDRRGLQRIERDLQAGALTGAGVEATGEEPPHGGLGG